MTAPNLRLAESRARRTSDDFARRTAVQYEAALIVDHAARDERTLRLITKGMASMVADHGQPDRVELVHLIAYAMAWVEHMDREAAR